MTWPTMRYLTLLYLPLWVILAAQAPDPAPKCPPSALALIRVKCQPCHSSTIRGGLLMMDSVDNMVRGGKHGPAIVVNDPDASLVYAVLVGRTNIPKVTGHKVPASDVALIRTWLVHGSMQTSMSACSP